MIKRIPINHYKIKQINPSLKDAEELISKLSRMLPFVETLVNVGCKCEFVAPYVCQPCHAKDVLKTVKEALSVWQKAHLK